jgi:hypothetical protein
MKTEMNRKVQKMEEALLWITLVYKTASREHMAKVAADALAEKNS